MPKIGVFTHVRTLEPVMIADLDTLLIALYVELTDRIIPVLGFPRSGPGQRPEVTDAELVCLAVAQVLLRYDGERRWLPLTRTANGRQPFPGARPATGRCPRRNFGHSDHEFCRPSADLAAETNDLIIGGRLLASVQGVPLDGPEAPEVAIEYLPGLCQ